MSFSAEETYLSSAVFLYNRFNFGGAEIYIFLCEKRNR